MALLFNSILTQEGIDPGETLWFATKICARRKDGRHLSYGVFDRPAFDGYQTHQNPDRRSQFQRAKFWASFVATPAGESLFTGVYRAAYVGLQTMTGLSPTCPALTLPVLVTCTPWKRCPRLTI